MSRDYHPGFAFLFTGLHAKLYISKISQIVLGIRRGMQVMSKLIKHKV